MLKLSKAEIKIAIPKVKIGLNKYLWIQNEFKKRDVGKDREFQKKFNGFYRIRFKGEDWKREFYKLLEEGKGKNLVFKDVLIDMYKRTGNIEASFISKLIATIDPEKAVIDSIVFNNLGLKLPSSNVENRIEIINDLYLRLNKIFLSFLKTEEAKYLIDEFSKEYPETNITRVKMLDLVLWQIRD